MIRLPEIKTADLSTYGNFAKCHQAHFRVPHVGLGTRLMQSMEHLPAHYCDQNMTHNLKPQNYNTGSVAEAVL